MKKYYIILFIILTSISINAQVYSNVGVRRMQAKGLYLENTTDKLSRIKIVINKDESILDLEIPSKSMIFIYTLFDGLPDGVNNVDKLKKIKVLSKNESSNAITAWYRIYEEGDKRSRIVAGDTGQNINNEDRQEGLYADFRFKNLDSIEIKSVVLEK